MKDFDSFEVTDRKSFIEFLKLFHADLKLNPENWENKTLDDFLEAMTRYSGDIEGYYANKNETTGGHTNADLASWRTFADILRGTRIYE